MIRLQEVELDFGHTEVGNTDGRMDRRGSRNSYLDVDLFCRLLFLLKLILVDFYINVIAKDRKVSDTLTYCGLTRFFVYLISFL